MKFETLTRDKMLKVVDELVELEESYSPEVSERWNRNNFLYDLPRKWEFSQIASDDRVKGYIICSAKESDIEGERKKYYFVHRTFVHPSVRGQNPILARLFLRAKRLDLKGITQALWKCSTKNTRVYEFHLEFADKILREEEINGIKYVTFTRRI